MVMASLQEEITRTTHISEPYASCKEERHSKEPAVAFTSWAMYMKAQEWHRFLSQIQPLLNAEILVLGQFNGTCKYQFLPDQLWPFPGGKPGFIFFIYFANMAVFVSRIISWVSSRALGIDFQLTCAPSSGWHLPLHTKTKIKTNLVPLAF